VEPFSSTSGGHTPSTHVQSEVYEQIANFQGFTLPNIQEQLVEVEKNIHLEINFTPMQEVDEAIMTWV
jgi:hypothetical protein